MAVCGYRNHRGTTIPSNIPTKMGYGWAYNVWSSSRKHCGADVGQIRAEKLFLFFCNICGAECGADLPHNEKSTWCLFQVLEISGVPKGI